MIKYGARVGMKFKSRVRDIASLNGIWELKTDAYDIGVHNLWYENGAKFDLHFKIPGSINEIDELSHEYPGFSLKNSYSKSYWLKKEFLLKDIENRLVFLKIGGISAASIQ